jgi:predicted amidohydrolase YtcJ
VGAALIRLRVPTSIVSLIALWAATLATPGFSQSKPVADLIIEHAKIWTDDKSKPTAEAVAVLGERIVAVGSNAEIDAWRGPKTTVVDAQGKLLLPGFNDAHCHFVSGGQQLDQVDLNDADSAEEFKRRIAERARITPKGKWIEGGNWDETKWSPPDLPTHTMIDSVTAGVPMLISRYDGHVAFANETALRLAGITAATPNPPGGVIVHDSRGNPTGVFKDAAMNLVADKIPPLTHAERVHAAQRAIGYAASLGVTSCQNMDNDDGQSYEDLKVFSELHAQGALITRLYVAPSIVDWQDQAKLGVRPAFGSSDLRIGGLKGYSDGSLGASTAYFFEPYTDAPGTRGIYSDEMQPPASMRERILKADAAGLQICIHAIGDQGISTILDYYADAVKLNGAADRRFRIEHAQHMAAKDFDRFAKLGVIASVQPYHAIDDGRWAESRIGHDRASRTYAFRTFLDHGVRLALGTDWPVAPLNPMLTIFAAVTRATLDGKHPEGWFPEQKLTVEETVDAYTMGSAYAEFQEKEKGSITAGKLADLVLLSDDIFSIPVGKIRDAHVLRTFVGGRQVFDRAKATPPGQAKP